jgi:hypothetical protein
MQPRAMFLLLSAPWESFSALKNILYAKVSFLSDQLSQGGVFCETRKNRQTFAFSFMAALFDALNFDFACGRLMMDHQI